MLQLRDNRALERLPTSPRAASTNPREDDNFQYYEEYDGAYDDSYGYA